MLADLLRLAGLGQDMELFASLQVRHRGQARAQAAQTTAVGQPEVDARARDLDVDLNLRINNNAGHDATNQPSAQLGPLDLTVNSKQSASNTSSSKQVRIEQNGSSLSPLGSPSSMGSVSPSAGRPSSSEVISSSSSSSSTASSSSCCVAPSSAASAHWPVKVDHTDKPATSQRRRRQRQASSTKSARSAKSKGAGRAHLCLQCGRSFSRSDMLTRHSRLHSGLKPYQCNRCKQVFSRSDHLSTHERTHTGEKPYRCAQCEYSACRRDMITRHMRTHANGQSNRPEVSAARKLHRRRTKSAKLGAELGIAGDESRVSTSVDKRPPPPPPQEQQQQLQERK